MKERLPPDFRWTKDSSLAEDILSARLRAKYYGAQVISYRTFLLRILEASGSGFKISEDFIEDVAISDRQNLEYAQKCIDALVNSTTAFHSLGDPGKDRLLVTNIWGTAHAYVLKVVLQKKFDANETQSMGQCLNPSCSTST